MKKSAVSDILKTMRNTVVLVVLDGWGIGVEGDSNPIHVAKPKNIEYIKNNFPSGALQASGIAVGLPWGEEGNSEVGHLTMGAGKIIYQHYPRISLAVRDGSFFSNPTINGVFDHAQKNNTKTWQAEKIDFHVRRCAPPPRSIHFPWLSL